MIKPLKKPKKISTSKLKKKADTLFSLYIRLSNADWRGYVTCYTCGKVAHYKDGMQCGHFVPRGKLATRYDKNNSRVQCVACNVFLKGNYIEYTLRMIDEVGEDKVRALREKGEEITKLDYVGIIKELEEDLKKLPVNTS